LRINYQSEFSAESD